MRWRPAHPDVRIELTSADNLQWLPQFFRPECRPPATIKSLIPNTRYETASKLHLLSMRGTLMLGQNQKEVREAEDAI